jgi:hypothetical protein
VASPAMESKAWQRLRGRIADEVFTAPRTGGDPHNQGHWPEVPHRVVNYLERNLLSTPWANTAALLAAIMMARRFEVSSVICKMVILHSRFTSLFACLGLARMEDWNATLHIPMYLSAEILPDDPQSIRQKFWVTYSSASKTMAQWFGTFPECQKPNYQQFILPTLSRLFVEGLVRQKEVTQQQQRTRKAETDGVVPRFAAIRAETHFRYNRVARLRRAYLDALRSLKPGTGFPLAFSYEEGEDKERGMPAQERLWFRIWDRRSFVLAHADAYSYNAVATARRGIGSFADGVNHVFLEFCPRGATVWRGARGRVLVRGDLQTRRDGAQSVRGFGRGSESQASLVVFLGIRQCTIPCSGEWAAHVARGGRTVHGIRPASHHRGALAG